MRKPIVLPRAAIKRVPRENKSRIGTSGGVWNRGEVENRRPMVLPRGEKESVRMSGSGSVRVFGGGATRETMGEKPRTPKLAEEYVKKEVEVTEEKPPQPPKMSETEWRLAEYLEAAEKVVNQPEELPEVSAEYELEEDSPPPPPPPEMPTELELGVEGEPPKKRKRRGRRSKMSEAEG